MLFLWKLWIAGREITLLDGEIIQLFPSLGHWHAICYAKMIDKWQSCKSVEKKPYLSAQNFKENEVLCIFSTITWLSWLRFRKPLHRFQKFKIHPIATFNSYNFYYLMKPLILVQRPLERPFQRPSNWSNLRFIGRIYEFHRYTYLKDSQEPAFSLPPLLFGQISLYLHLQKNHVLCCG